MDALPQAAHQIRVLFALAQGGQGHGGGGAFLAAGLEKGGEQGIGTEFHQDAGVGVQGGQGRVHETHRPADVAPPIGGAQVRARADRAGDRGQKGNAGRPGLQIGQPFQQPVPDRVHAPAVEGIAQGQAPADQPAAAQVGGQGVQGGVGTGEGHVAGAVDRGHFQFAVAHGRQLVGLGRGELGHGHAAQAVGLALQDAAFHDDPAGVGQG
jgi:hypothetical protein